MIKKCSICGKDFSFKRGNKKYCSEICKKVAYKDYNYSSEESVSKYKEKIKEELGLDETGYNAEFRERTANNRGMTVQEYNRYLEENRAIKLGITVEELRHAVYIAKKTGSRIHEELGMTLQEYKLRLKRK